MDKQDHQFTPETVDEQVDRLLLDQRRNSPEGRMVYDLQNLYQNDTHSLERVWQRLETDSSQAGAKWHSQPLLERSMEGAKILSLEKSRRTRQRSSSISRHLSLIAAVFVATLIVGSMLWVFGATRSVPTATTTAGKTGQIPPTPAPQSLASGIYAVGDKGLFRLDQYTHKTLWQAAGSQSDVIRTLPIGDRIYTLTAGTTSASPAAVTVFAANSGEQLWTHMLGARHTASDMLIKGSRIYLSQYMPNESNTANTDELTVLSTSDGSPVATYPFPNVISALGIDDNLLYVGTNKGLQALDPANGKQRWETPFKAKNSLFFRSIQSLNGILYASIADSSELGGQSAAYVAAYAAKNGKQIWQTPVLSYDALSAFVIDGSAMYFGSLRTSTTSPFSGLAYAYDIKSGQQLWMQKISGGVQQAPVVSNGSVYFNADGGNQFPGYVVALDATNGNTRWERKLDDPQVSSLCIQDGILYVANQGFSSQSLPNALYAFSASGKLLWKDTRFGSVNMVIPTA